MDDTTFCCRYYLMKKKVLFFHIYQHTIDLPFDFSERVLFIDLFFMLM